MSLSRPLSPTLGALLERIFVEGTKFALPPFAPVVGGTWGDLDLRGLWGPLSVDGPTLEWEVNSVHAAEDESKLLRTRSLTNEPAILDLADGTRVVAKFGGWARFGARGRLGFGDVCEFNVWNVEGPAPARWVGEIKGCSLTYGNLDIAVPGRRSWGNTRIEGNYVWNLIRQDGHTDSVVAVIEPATTGIATLDREALRVDFDALQFCFGSPMQMDTVVAVDEPGNVLGGAGVHLGGNRATRQGGGWDGPVPSGRAWVAVLFHRLSRAMMSRDLPWGVACGAYLDSVSDSTIDGRYLKLQVALEGFATALLSEASAGVAGERRLLVKDAKVWKAWLKSHEPELREFAVDEASLPKFWGKLHQAIQLPSSATVADALSRLDPPLAVDQRVLDELKDRNIPAHHGTMNRPDVAYDIERDIVRIDILRSLLVALVARVCGYDGPIAGWERSNPAGWKPPPVWWPAPAAATVAESMVRYTHERTSQPRTRSGPFRSRLRTWSR